MQALYAWEMDHDTPVMKLEGQLKTQIQKSITLYLTDLTYLIDVCQYSMVDKAKRLAKYIKTDEDKNASTTIAANAIINFLQEDPQLIASVKKEGVKNYVDEEVVKSVYNDLCSKPKYKEYCALEKPSFEEDKEIIQFILRKVFLSNKELENHLEELFINYDDDNALLLHIIGKYVDTFDPEKKDTFFQSMDIWEEEKKFAIDLLAKALEREDPIAHLSPYGTAVAVRLSACRELGLDPDEIPDP